MLRILHVSFFHFMLWFIYQLSQFSMLSFACAPYGDFYVIPVEEKDRNRQLPGRRKCSNFKRLVLALLKSYRHHMGASLKRIRPFHTQGPTAFHTTVSYPCFIQRFIPMCGPVFHTCVSYPCADARCIAALQILFSAQAHTDIHS